MSECERKAILRCKHIARCFAERGEAVCSTGMSGSYEAAAIQTVLSLVKRWDTERNCQCGAMAVLPCMCNDAEGL